MTQEEHIAELQRRSEYIKKTCNEIQRFFEAYLAGNDTAFDDMLVRLDKLYGGMVRRNLQLAGCLNRENENDAMQDARLAVWTYAQNCREEGIVNASFAGYCRGIYKYKVLDVVRKVLTERARLGTDYTDTDERSDAQEMQYGTIVSLNAPDKTGDSELGDNISADGTKRPVEGELEEKLRRALLERLFYLYCYCLTQADALPPSPLALYYARLLPHILHVNYEAETIPDSKASSPKWAFGCMGDKTVGTLGAESEHGLQQHVAKELSWCKKFYAQMDTPTETPNGIVPLKDIVYTVQYTEKQLGHWADYMHKTVTHACTRAVRAEGLLEEIKDYICSRDKAVDLVKGRG